MSATGKSERLAQTVAASRSLRGAKSLVVLLAPSPCPAAATSRRSRRRPAPPPVTVAQPTKRTVTDWDEFTGRFEAVEEVQVRARVGGFVTSVEFRDGAFVNTGDLLYVIDPRPFEAVGEQADGQLSDARAKAELGKRELDRALDSGPDPGGRGHGRRSAPPGFAGRQCRRDCRPKARSRRPSSISNSPMWWRRSAAGSAAISSASAISCRAATAARRC